MLSTRKRIRSVSLLPFTSLYFLLLAIPPPATQLSLSPTGDHCMQPEEGSQRDSRERARAASQLFSWLYIWLYILILRKEESNQNHWSWLKPTLLDRSRSRFLGIFITAIDTKINVISAGDFIRDLPTILPWTSVRNDRMGHAQNAKKKIKNKKETVYLTFYNYRISILS